MNEKPTETRRSVKIEVFEDELHLNVYLLGALDLRTEPKTLRLALAYREKLENALKFLGEKSAPKKDKYGKVISENDEVTKHARRVAPQAVDRMEKEKAQEVAEQFSQAEQV